MTKAENIFRATRHEAIVIIKGNHHDGLSEHWIIGGWCYGKTPEGQKFMSQRTLNDVNKLIAKEERRLDMNDKYGVSERDPEWAATQREALRVLKDMSANQQKELDREKEERRARKTMGYDEFMAKYYPQYC